MAAPEVVPAKIGKPKWHGLVSVYGSATQARSYAFSSKAPHTRVGNARSVRSSEVWPGPDGRSGRPVNVTTTGKASKPALADFPSRSNELVPPACYPGKQASIPAHGLQPLCVIKVQPVKNRFKLRINASILAELQASSGFVHQTKVILCGHQPGEIAPNGADPVDRSQPVGALRGQRTSIRRDRFRGDLRWILTCRIRLPALFLIGADALLNAGKVALLGRRRDCRSNRVQIHVTHARKQRSVVLNALGFETPLPETARACVFGVGAPGVKCTLKGDCDGDGDVDYGIYARNDSVYWFENRGVDDWVRHTVGALPMRGLGGAVLDVDDDGHTDILVGGLWYRNPGNPTEAGFKRYTFDDRIDSEMHDMVTADVNGNGEQDLVSLGDEEGVFWYSIPDKPAQNENWPRTTVTRSVIDGRVDIHAGLFPKGVGDLDGDGDADIVLADRWLENRKDGTEWTRHLLPFGARGPWGLSSRSWIQDLNGDGQPDIIMVEADGTGSGGAWLENDGGSPPSFIVHELPTTARGTRGSFHSLYVADFDNDGDADILTVEQEDTSIFPMGAPPRWYIWENEGGESPSFTERIIFDGRLGGHDALAADVDGDGDLDILSKVWNVWGQNANGGRVHVDVLENTLNE